MGISYSDAQSLSTCRAFPKDGNYMLPRCRSYRLRKTQLLTDPRETLTSIANRANESRTLFFSRVNFVICFGSIPFFQTHYYSL